MPRLDYSRFDRLVVEDELEDQRLEAQRKQADEDSAKRDVEARRKRELDALRCAEEEWRRSAAGANVPSSTFVAPVEPVVEKQSMAIGSPTDDAEVINFEPVVETSDDHKDDEIMKATKNIARSKLAGVDFSNMSKEEIEDIDVDDFFRPLSEEERRERARLKEEKEERRRLREEAAGKRPLRDKGMTSDEVQKRIAQLQEDRKEMVILMDYCDRPAVKARLSDFVVEMDNDLARLQEDPLELDDEDRRELRLFHLRKMQLPGVARTQRDFAEETRYLPTALDGGAAVTRIAREDAWQEISEFALDLGEAETPEVTVDVRIEAVERLPPDAVSCQFWADSFDLRVVHGLEGRRYRLLKTCLQRDIVPERSSFRIKRNHVIVSLAKQEANQGSMKYLPWEDLCAVDRHSRNRDPVRGQPPLVQQPGGS